MESDKIYTFKDGNGLKRAERAIMKWYYSDGRDYPDFSILKDERFVQAVPDSKSLKTTTEIDLDPYEVAKDISNACPEGFLLNSLDNKGLWLWLTIFYLTNMRKLKNIKYYIPQIGSEYSWNEWYKHMLRQTMLVYEKFGIDAKILMPAKLGGTSDSMDWAVSTPWFLESNIIRAENMLYRDEDMKGWKKAGMVSKDMGSVKHFNWFIKKLRAVYIVEEMTAEEIFEIVSKDPTFKRFI